MIRDKGGKIMKDFEKEYPILKEERRRKESKDRNIESLIYLGVGLLGIAIGVLYLI